MPDDKLIKELEEKLMNQEYFEDPETKKLAILTQSGDKFIWDSENKSWRKSDNKDLVDVPQADLFKPSDTVKAQQDWWKADNKKNDVAPLAPVTKWKDCTHKPTLLLQDKTQGWEVWAGKRYDVLNKARQFDLVLNLSGHSAKENHIIPVPELQHWEKYSTLNEILLDWPDFEDVSLPYLFWRDLIKYLAKTQGKMLVFCIGGHGRTGTAMAALMVACGWSADAAMHWIWKNYCKKAIESQVQERYIERLEAQRREWFRTSHKKRPIPEIVISEQHPENELDKNCE